MAADKVSREALAELDKLGRDFGTVQGYQYRADTKLSASDGRRIDGYALVFNRPSRDLGGFIEVIDPLAVDRTLRSGEDVFSLFSHDWARVLGRTSAGTTRLAKDAYGLRVVTDPPDPTDPPNLLESIRRRDITGMSFGFVTMMDKWDWEQEIPVRTLLDIQLLETSIVARPAYTDTSVGVRAFQTVARHYGHHWEPSAEFLRREKLAKEATRGIR